MNLRELVAALRPGLCHATCRASYAAILAAGSIEPNDGSRKFTFETSKLSNCFELGAVSLFDFERPGDSQIFDRINEVKWTDVLLGPHRPTLVFRFAREKLPGRLIEYAEAKRCCGLGGIIPHLEVCHVGPIPIEAVIETIVVTSLPIRNFERTFEVQIHAGAPDMSFLG